MAAAGITEQKPPQLAVCAANPSTARPKAKFDTAAGCSCFRPDFGVGCPESPAAVQLSHAGGGGIFAGEGATADHDATHDLPAVHRAIPAERETDRRDHPRSNGGVELGATTGVVVAGTLGAAIG